MNALVNKTRDLQPLARAISARCALSHIDAAPTVAMPPKKKAKLVARKSTGGKAPRKQLAAQAARQETRRERDGWGNPINEREEMIRRAENEVRQKRADANKKKKKKAKKGEREIYSLMIYRAYGEDDNRTNTLGLYASWERCCEAADEFMTRDRDESPWWECDSDDSDAEDQPEVKNVIAQQQTAGPPLEVGDKIHLVEASVGEPMFRTTSYREICIFAESHILYE